MNEHVRGTAKPKGPSREGVEGKPGKTVQVELRGQVGGMNPCKAKGFKQDINMIILAFQED